jgi:alginate O-acetyltransferase complex protein AlgI
VLFNSVEFALFFPAVVFLYFAIPPRRRTLLLLGASCLFYMAFIPAYILILAVTIAIDYAAGMWLERTSGGARRVLLVTSIVATCAVLFVFKYFRFFTDNFVSLAQLFGWQVHSPAIEIILPIGLSFHTFQSLSYVIEVYYRRQKAEHNFVAYATYVMFFPQLVAGPIERPQNLLHQFWETHEYDHVRVTSGLKRMAWGFFKKLVVADRLALYVNDVYAAPTRFNGLQLTVATLFFAYQIYCDFSGYSDIAIGAARVLGFRLTENFRTPYWSRSIADFWRRWHISLSTWLRDYIFLKLSFVLSRRLALVRWLGAGQDVWVYAGATMTTMLLGGLWHGANWTYVVWGGLQGLYLVAGTLTKPLRSRFYRVLRVRRDSRVRALIGIGTTFGMTCVAWTVFRARSTADAWYILTHLWRGWDPSAIATEQFLLRQMPVAILSIAFVEWVQWAHGRVSLTRQVGRLPVLFRWPAYAGFVLAVVLFGVYTGSQFIYFQF